MGNGSSWSHEIQSKAKNSTKMCNWYIIWFFLLFLSFLLYAPWLFLSPAHNLQPPCRTTSITSPDRVPFRGDLRELSSSWNELSFPSRRDSNPRLKIALFVKKWPLGFAAGGLERHARTLHRELALRGHEIHVFTTSAPRDRAPLDTADLKLMTFHFSKPTAAGNLNSHEAWDQFVMVNQTLRNAEGKTGFDVIHSESVALAHGQAAGLPNVVASWHGIGYETIHSDIVQDLTRNPAEPRTLDLQRALNDRLQRVIEEVKFFPSYAHHVGTSDSVGEVLRTIYMLPRERVHVIINGVDEGLFKPDESAGKSFRLKYGIPESADLVIGMAGRLVKDKGHPLVFEALQTIIGSSGSGNPNFFVLIAGDGPWAARYKELGQNVKVLGPLGAAQLGGFYNALDVFLNPTLRAQGLDHTTIEAMLCGKAVMVSHFASVVKSLIVSEDFGYTFSPRLESLKKGLERVLEDGKGVLKEKGWNCRRRAESLFTAKKMGAAYERLLLCIAKGNWTGIDFCKYPLTGGD
ncbi:hypothetical protein SUGI_0875510 [Cryptomeria japonica]|uniref:uncharacterized protein LOC131054852 n=1 Tax=Cryptomeria japonica TaxID=3369 RepID=UPI00241499EC|nr:uncharacterized protein LOC131054852 [Cryptomeria japonica]GLJ42293.1 hypothetical protein SUGI_0875510 [Cryptomeria japonica]